MRKFIERYVGATHVLILEEKDVLEVLSVINDHGKPYISQSLSVMNCGWEDEPTKWGIDFNATSNQWSSIIDTLMDKGFLLVIKDCTGYIHLIRD